VNSFSGRPTRWDQCYIQTQYQASKYLIGIIAGYAIYKNNKEPKRFNQIAVKSAWIFSISVILTSIFTNPKNHFSDFGGIVYDSIQHEVFACAICWIIFACHNLKSGGILRKFLSLDFWQPLSKLCLSVYMVHLIYIMYTMDYGKVSRLPGLRWLIHVSVGDIVVSSVIGLILHLFVEAPAVKIVDCLLGKSKTKEKSKIVNKTAII
jgi:peptidoglycan/LPS O-acetylase OafA/YrhL